MSKILAEKKTDLVGGGRIKDENGKIVVEHFERSLGSIL